MKAGPDGRVKLTLATRVTLARILGIPVFVLLMIYYAMSLRAGRPDEYLRVAALAAFLLIALTDALDGFLARRRGEVTALGAVLDPLADKSLLLSAVIVLTRPGLPALQPQLPVWFSVIVISRDAMLVAGFFLIRHFAGAVKVRPRRAGKLSTFLLIAAVTWALADGPAAPFRWLCALAAGVTLVAGLQYVVDGIRQLERAHAARRHPNA
jgi:cardiolipin synthase